MQAWEDFMHNVFREVLPFNMDRKLNSPGSACRRRGIARTLLQACEDASRRAGLDTLTLHARLADDAALQASDCTSVYYHTCRKKICSSNQVGHLSCIPASILGAAPTPPSRSCP